MHVAFRTFAPVLVSLVLAGCSLPRVKSLTEEAAAPFQPIDVKVVVRHPQLYGAYYTMKITPRSANPCLPDFQPDAIPEIAWDCGGTTDMVAAKLTASRARKAEAAVRPLRGDVADLDIAALLNDSISQSLQTLPNAKVVSWSLMKKPRAAALEDAYRASTASAVLFIYLDYHLSPDFSAFEVSAESRLHARSPAARRAAGFDTAPAGGSTDGLPTLLPSNAIYRSTVTYHADLPPQADDSLADYAATWQADGGRLVRAAIEDARVQLPRLMADEFQRANDVRRPVLSRIEEQGLTMDLVAEKGGNQWLVMPDGSLYYKTKVPGTARAVRPAVN